VQRAARIFPEQLEHDGLELFARRARSHATATGRSPSWITRFTVERS